MGNRKAEIHTYTRIENYRYIHALYLANTHKNILLTFIHNDILRKHSDLGTAVVGALIDGVGV